MTSSTNERTRRPRTRARAIGAAAAASLVVAVGLGMTAVAFGVHQPGVDVQVNNSGTDAGDNTTQSETALAVNGNTVCAGFNDSGPNAGLSGFARSTNLGDTWTDQGELGANNNGDPVVAVNRTNGTFYYANNATIGGPAIGVSRSTDGCQTFGAQIDASAASSGLNAQPNRTTLSDKPWIAVDNTGGANNGNIYVCWTRFIDTTGPPAADQSELRFSRSTDGGATYVNEQVLQANGPAPFGCSVGVSPNGQVNVTWADRVGGTAGDIRFRASTDGGVNFGANTQVSTGNRVPGTDRVVMCDVNRTTLNGNIRMLHQSWLAVDSTGGPFDGNLYVVWASDPVSAPMTSDHSDVFFSRSTNGGANWSAPLQLGGGTVTDQFEPFVAVGGAGAVSVAWYDRRNDAANNLAVDVFKAFSSDGGANFGAIARVTDQSFNLPQLNPNFDPAIALCYMGEYIGVAADDRNFYYLWGDNRNTVTNANWPAGRPDPDVWFESEPAPVVNNADLGITKSDSSDPAVAGEQLTYTITVTNSGPHIALDVVVTDTLPSEVTYVSDTGSCDTSGLPTLTCSLGDMPAAPAAGSTRSFTITVMVKRDVVHNAGAPTTITNTASVDGVANDSNTANDSDSESTLIVAVADLEIISFAAQNPPVELFVGDSVPVTLRKVITNNGPSAPMDVRVTKTATATPGATVTPALETHVELALGYQEQRTLDELFTIGCTEAGPATFTFTNNIKPERAGDTDPDLSNNNAQTSFVVQCLAYFLVLDDEAITKGEAPNFFRDRDVNEDLARLARRTQLRYFADNVGQVITLPSGTTGDEGWFAPKEIPSTWAAAGPTADGLRNYLGNPAQPFPHNVGPGLGTGSNPERLLDNIPRVTPLRATALKMLIGRQVCAVVYKSDVSINYNPLRGSLKGATRGTVAFKVQAVTPVTGGSSSTLPRVRIQISDANKVCEQSGALRLFTTAPEPISSSQPPDTT